MTPTLTPAERRLRDMERDLLTGHVDTALVKLRAWAKEERGSDVEVKAPMFHPRPIMRPECIRKEFPKTQPDRSSRWPLAALLVGAVVWVGAVAWAINGFRY